MACIMIVSHTNRPDHFHSLLVQALAAGWLVGWLNRFIYRANIAEGRGGRLQAGVLPEIALFYACNMEDWAKFWLMNW